MGARTLAPACLLAACALLAAACGERRQASDTAVMGGTGPEPAASVPSPPVPRTATPETASIGRWKAVAVWEQEGKVMAARYAMETGWGPPHALEQIGGQASDAKVAGNGKGVAMAIWRHSVGQIDSLRYSRYQEGRGWSEPDVMPGALPKPRRPGKTAGGVVEHAAPRIEVDARGNAIAQWPSGFDADQMQVSTFVPGEGWARPIDVPLDPNASGPQQSAAKQ